MDGPRPRRGKRHRVCKVRHVERGIQKVMRVKRAEERPVCSLRTGNRQLQSTPLKRQKLTRLDLS